MTFDNTCLPIANAALVLVGTRLLATPTDNSKECKLISTNWDTYRLAVLRDAFWKFASTRASLVQNTSYTAPWVGSFSNQFNLPADFVRLIDVNGANGALDDDTEAWKMESGALITNMSQVNIRYVNNNVTVSTWDPLFIDTFAAYIASQISFSLTNSETERDNLFKLYKEKRQHAVFVGAAENPAEVVDADVWLRSRLGVPGFPRDPSSITFDTEGPI